MFRRGFRLFSAASVLCLVTAAFHAIGNVAPPPSDPAIEQALDTMRQTRLPMPLAPSFLDAHVALSWTMSVLLLALGVQNLLQARAAGEPARLRPYAVLGAGWALVLAAVYIGHRLVPPAVSLGLVGALYVGAIATLRET